MNVNIQYFHIAECSYRATHAFHKTFCSAENAEKHRFTYWLKIRARM